MSPVKTILGFIKILFIKMAKKIKVANRKFTHSKQLKKTAKKILKFRIDSLISTVEKIF